MDKETTPTGTAVATTETSFSLSKTAKIVSSFESSEHVTATRKSGGVHLQMGPDGSKGFSLGGWSVLLSTGEAELLAKELLRVASAEPPAE